jgi:hypothetical protein
MDAAIGRHHVIARVSELRERGGNILLPPHGPVSELKMASRNTRQYRALDCLDAVHRAEDGGQCFRIHPDIGLRGFAAACHF